MLYSFRSPLFLVAALATPALAQRELPPIPGPGTQANGFGWALDVDGPWLVVGEPGGQGRTHVYDSQSGDWVRTLSTSGSNFGSAIAVDGDLALVGRPLFDHGAASLFDLTTGAKLWTQSSNANDFGRAVALGGGRALVGAPDQASERGRVYVLDLATGAVLATLAASDPVPGARFGASLAIAGDTALIGASQVGASGGHAYVFDLATGTEVARLSCAAPYDFVGGGVAIDGTRLLVTSLDSQALGHALHVFDAATFQEVTKVDVGDPQSLVFKLADAGGGQALVQATEGSHHSRVMYVIDLASGALVQRLVPAGSRNDAESSGFGPAGALGVGGPTYVGDFAGLGRVRRYTTDPTLGATYCSPAEQHSGGVAGELRAWGSDVLADDDLMLRADSLPASNWGYLLASRTTGFVSHPGNSDGNLCLGGDIGRFVSQTADSQGWGAIALWVDLQALPHPLGALVPGDSLHFQMWFRDGTHSNFTDAVKVTFQ